MWSWNWKFPLPFCAKHEGTTLSVTLWYYFLLPLIFFVSTLDFIKYIPFRSFWINKAVWDIGIVSAGRGSIKILWFNYYWCIWGREVEWCWLPRSGRHSISTVIISIVVYRSINYHFSAKNQDLPCPTHGTQSLWDQLQSSRWKGTYQSYPCQSQLPTCHHLLE